MSTLALAEAKRLTKAASISACVPPPCAADRLALANSISAIPIANRCHISLIPCVVTKPVIEPERADIEPECAEKIVRELQNHHQTVEARVAKRRFRCQTIAMGTLPESPCSQIRRPSHHPGRRRFTLSAPPTQLAGRRAPWRPTLHHYATNGHRATHPAPQGFTPSQIFPSTSLPVHPPYYSPSHASACSGPARYTSNPGPLVGLAVLGWVRLCCCCAAVGGRWMGCSVARLYGELVL